MNITSIKYANLENTHLLIDDDYVIPWPSHTWHRDGIQAWLDAGNVIAPWKTQADIDAANELERVATWKRECRTRIFNIFSDSDQRNGAMESFSLLQKMVSGDALTTAEQQRIQTLNSAKEWIEEMVRFSRSNIADPAKPLHADSVQWPQHPKSNNAGKVME